MTGISDGGSAGESPGQPSPVSLLPAVVWVALLGLAAIGWAITVFQIRSMVEMGGMPDMPPIPTPALPFLSAWTAMMAAMMLPSVAPTAAAFAAIGYTPRQAGRRVAPTWLFLVGYLTIWCIFGAGAYLVSMTAPGLRASSPAAGGLVLIAAGLYQWSPLKKASLGRCRSPLAFLRRVWHKGAAGAFRTGIVHGIQCVGCCGGLMLVLSVVGLMNLGWMVLLAAVTFAEKVLPQGQRVGQLAGAAIFVSGVAMLTAR